MRKNYINPRCVPLKMYRRQMYLNVALLVTNILAINKIANLETKIDLLYQKIDIQQNK